PIGLVVRVLLVITVWFAASPPAARGQCARTDKCAGDVACPPSGVCADGQACCPCPLPPYTCKLDGSDLCTAVVGLTSMPQAISNVVRVRNKYRVNTPIGTPKILFSSRSTFNGPANPGPVRGYSLDLFYDRLPGTYLQYNQSDYYVSPDGGPLKAGIISYNPSMFPVASYAIDCGPAPQVAARSQVDVAGKDLVMEFTKGTSITSTSPLSGWGTCTTFHSGVSCAPCPCPPGCGTNCDFQ